MRHMAENNDRPPVVPALQRRHTLWPTNPLGQGAVVVGGIGAAVGGIATVLTLSIEPGQGAFIGGFAVLTGAVLTFLNGKYTRDQTSDVESGKLAVEELKLAEQKSARDQLHRRETARELRARFATCSDQLGSESFAIRLAGVYAFAALADDFGAEGNTADRQVCVDVLCGYLRTAATSNTHSPSSSAATTPSTDPLPQELEVRSTIVRVIAEHTRMVHSTGGHTAEERDGEWQNCNFDLTGAVLHSINWSRCRFLGNLELTGATFVGGANLTHSIFERVHLGGARFLAEKDRGHVADFSQSHFIDAVFEWAVFEAETKFRGAKNDGQMDFTLARFAAPVSFAAMHFTPNSGTTFQRTRFGTVVDFSRARFEGQVWMGDALFDDVQTLVFWSIQRWTVAPTIPWDDEDPPTCLQGSWPPELAQDLRARAERDSKTAVAAPAEPSSVTSAGSAPVD